MRIVTLVLAALIGCASEASATVPNMTCTAIGSVASGATITDRIQTVSRSTDVFRFKDGKLFHQISGRAESLYNDVVEVESGRYASGHMQLVVPEPGGRKGQDRKGYVVVAAPTDWRVVYIDCRL